VDPSTFGGGQYCLEEYYPDEYYLTLKVEGSTRQYSSRQYYP